MFYCLEMATQYNEDDRDTLIKTVWGEARNQSADGQKAVAHTVLNRSNDPGKRYGNGIKEVCQRPQQYACWNKTDQNYKPMTNLKKTDNEYKTIEKNLSSVFSGTDPDNTNKSKHYHTATTKADHPWAKGKSPTAEIGDHCFYNKIDD